MKNVNDVLFQKIGNTWFAFTKIKLVLHHLHELHIP